MGVRYRVDQARAEMRLRPIRVGRWAECRGKPIIDASDATAGDAFRVYSLDATTCLLGDGQLRIGDDVFLNSGVRLECCRAVTIGDHVLVAFGVLITDTDSHGVEGRATREKPVTIGSRSWIGARSIILPGVSIGEGCIIGAGSVVTRSVPAWTLAAGNPARPIRELTCGPAGRSAADG